MKYEKPNMEIVEFDQNDIAMTLITSEKGQGTNVDTSDWW